MQFYKNIFLDQKYTGFTLLEVVVTLSFVVLFFLCVALIYTNVSRYSQKQTTKLELTQNGRVVLDRVTRELRQASEIVSSLPETKDDPDNPPLEEIKFQDGHNLDAIQYIRYYKDGAEIKREVSHYYFASDPSTWVRWDSVDENNDPPEEAITEDYLIGEYIDGFRVYGANLIGLELDLLKNNQKFYLQTKAGGRNL